MNIEGTLDTDVLILGGGLAGCWAAISARSLSRRVLLLDKGKVSKSGCSTFAAGDIACPLPEEDQGLMIREIEEVGRGLCHRDWVKMCVEQIYARVKDMEGFGIKFEKEGDRFVQAEGRGKVVKSVMVPGRQLMSAMRAQVERSGAQIQDRLLALRLVVEDGRCRGALAVDTRSGKFYIISARSVVLTAGGCSFGGTYYGNQFSTGDSHALAYYAGAEQLGFEFVSHNSTHRLYDISGMSRFVGSGGRFINSLGQQFMERHDPEFGNRAPQSTLIVGMAKEVAAGRGPIYFDFTGMTLVEEERYKRFLPHMPLILSRAGIDLKRDSMEWVPASGSTYSMSTGCKIDTKGQTSIPGLFAAGAAGAILRGTPGGLVGVPLMACCVSGHIVGLAAATPASPGPRPRASGDLTQAEETRKHFLAPLNIRDGRSYHEVLAEIQKAVFPAEVMILKEASRLKQARRRTNEIKEKLVPKLGAKDIHEAVRIREVKHILLCAQLFLTTSLARTESRGIHYREDFPEENDREWLKWLLVKQEKGQMKVWAEPVKERRS